MVITSINMMRNSQSAISASLLIKNASGLSQTSLINNMIGKQEKSVHMTKIINLIKGLFSVIISLYWQYADD